MPQEIKSIISKPSEALNAMVKGLYRQSRRKGFKIDMNTYGDSYHRSKICCGCAATCTIQEIAHKNLIFKKGEDIYYLTTRAEKLDLIKEDVDVFEMAIDSARVGNYDRLFEYFGISEYWSKEDFYLSTSNWKEDIPLVRKSIRKLEKAGY